MLSFFACLKVCAIVVAFANLAVGIYIFIYGIFLLLKYLNAEEDNIGFAIVYFQMTMFLTYIGLILLIGAIKGNQKYIALYLLLSCLTWFILTILIVTKLVAISEGISSDQEEHNKLIERIQFSIGLVAMWCGQLGVYRFYKQVVERNIINAGESYVSAAVHS